ncbi:hypothetical protein DBV15_04208 [Temnothorax longispinosus]|uniref:Uncharacterized protein n=1 Tax=Temnothorax longispinosus TaxID=300112 RepID=A0A4S2KHY8_9HYME|nr:hypothetical protein DBV15_04208 [Temnothorax longispinosus]
MEASERSVFALADDHKSVTRRLIRGSIRVQLARYESDVQCETMVHAFRVFRSAPTKLNVYKNDAESWDYTTPTLETVRFL